MGRLYRKTISAPGINPDFASRSNDHKTPEARLWRHVIDRAIMDAGSRKDARRLDVGRWMTSPDYETVCELADVNPDALFEQMRDVLLSKWPVSTVKANYLRRAILLGDPDLDP